MAKRCGPADPGRIDGDYRRLLGAKNVLPVIYKYVSWGLISARCRNSDRGGVL